ncbi:MAG: [Fe-Fe] hydrogenase large subunit C-terminal domain-containing protein [Thermoguttaceae bacterium]
MSKKLSRRQLLKRGSGVSLGLVSGLTVLSKESLFAQEEQKPGVTTNPPVQPEQQGVQSEVPGWNPLVKKAVQQPVVKNMEKVHVAIKPDNLSVIRNRDYCTRCGDCVDYCSRNNTVQGFCSLEGRESCINCGQCSTICSTQAITERPNFEEFWTALNDPEKIVVVSTSPALRVALGELFDMPDGSYVESQMVAALRKLGCDYVLDTTFGADLTIMEEAAELVERLQQEKSWGLGNSDPNSLKSVQSETGKMESVNSGSIQSEAGKMESVQPLSVPNPSNHSISTTVPGKTPVSYPLLTSCCPAWVRFAELYTPQLVQHLSNTKSPIMMQGSMIKTYFAKKRNLDPQKMVTVAITPCTAKKAEIKRFQSQTIGQLSSFPEQQGLSEMDIALTTRELGLLLNRTQIPFAQLPRETGECQYDSMLGRGSASGLSFGRSGGVLESALKTAYFMMFGKNPPATIVRQTPQGEIQRPWLEWSGFGRIPGVRQGTVDFEGRPVRVAIVETTGSLRLLLDMIERDGERFDFVEVMSCPGGCLGGGGQPIAQDRQQGKKRRVERKKAILLGEGEGESQVRFSHENPEIKTLYQEMLEQPLSSESKLLLHLKKADKGV